jgi:glc operon protein GlcG
MKARVLAIALTASLLALSAQAQQTPKPNPLDVIPDQMPFNIPYGPPIGLTDAKRVIAAAEAEGKKRGWPENIAVYDSGANLVAFERMDGAILVSVTIAQHKARAAVLFRRETKVFEAAVQNGANNILSLDDVIASRGGIPLIRNGKVIGAIGCSGGTGSQDEVLAKAGAAVISGEGGK